MAERFLFHGPSFVAGVGAAWVGTTCGLGYGVAAAVALIAFGLACDLAATWLLSVARRWRVRRAAGGRGR